MRGKSLECTNVGNSLFFQGDVAAADPMLVTHRGHAGRKSKVCLTPGSSFQKSESGDGGGLRMFVPGKIKSTLGTELTTPRGRGPASPASPPATDIIWPRGPHRGPHIGLGVIVTQGRVCHQHPLDGSEREKAAPVPASFRDVLGVQAKSPSKKVLTLITGLGNGIT